MLPVIGIIFLRWASIIVANRSCQPDINTREDDFFSRAEVTIYIYIYSVGQLRCLVKTRRFDGLRGEVGQKLETPFSTIRYLSIDEGAALWLRIRTFRVTCLIRTLLHALYLINNNFRILFSRINDQKSIRVWNRKTIIIYTLENRFES